jgi:hypothetical protein
MRRMVVSEFVTRNDVIEATGGEDGHACAGWVLEFPDPGKLEFKLGEVLACDAPE